MNKIFLRAITFCSFLIISVSAASAIEYSLTNTGGSIVYDYSDYTNDLSVAWNINVSQNRPISIEYYIDTESICDYISIYGVDNAGAKYLVVTTSGSQHGTISTIIPSGKARIEFHTDNSVSWTDYDEGLCDDEYEGISEIIYSVGADNSTTYSSNSFNAGNSLVGGKLGVGTITPATLLQVVGTTDISPSSHGLMVLGATNTTNIGFDQNEIMARNNGAISPLFLNNEGGNVIFNGTNTSGGNVGIGTSSPLSTLSINGGMHVGGDSNAGDNNLLVDGTTTSKGILNANGGIYLPFAASLGTAQTITAGYLAHGTGLFVGSSSIASDLNGTTFMLKINKSGVNAYPGHISYGIHTLVTSANSTSGTNIAGYFSASGATTANYGLIVANGNVGIGITNPDALLTVNGTIHAKEVKIDLSGSFADYVFEKNYILKSLNEVHSFIKENGHLPEIPSVEEVKKNGIDVAEMQVKLLKKIEELTLYAIQQQDKSIDQQKRIEALEKELRQVKNK